MRRVVSDCSFFKHKDKGILGKLILFALFTYAIIKKYF